MAVETPVEIRLDPPDMTVDLLECQDPLEVKVHLDAQGTADKKLEGDWHAPNATPHGIVLFVHGSGSDRKSKRHQIVANELRSRGFATLLIDLLTEEEKRADRLERHRIAWGKSDASAEAKNQRHDIRLHIKRLRLVTDSFSKALAARDLPICYYGASTGAGVAIRAAAEHPPESRDQVPIRAIVSRGGRIDLAEPLLLGLIPSHRLPPTLLIIGGEDATVRELSRRVEQLLQAERMTTAIIPGATHLFEESDAMSEVVRLTARWFTRYCP